MRKEKLYRKFRIETNKSENLDCEMEKKKKKILPSLTKVSTSKQKEQYF